jgi:hypothetical protein
MSSLRLSLVYGSLLSLTAVLFDLSACGGGEQLVTQCPPGTPSYTTHGHGAEPGLHHGRKLSHLHSSP